MRRHLSWVLGLVVFCVGLSASVADVVPKIGDRISLDVRTLDGKDLSSRDLEGRLVILEFWATWCGPCRGQIPHLKKLHAQYQPKGVVLMSVSVDDDRAKLEQFVKDNQMTWLQLFNNDMNRGGLVSKFFDGRYGIPHAFIISPKGTLLWTGSPRDIDAPLEQALKDHPPRTKRAAATDEEFVAAIKSANAAIDAKDMAALVDAVAGFPDSAFEDKAVAARMKALARRVTSAAVDPAQLSDALTGKTDVIAMFDKLKALSPTAAAAATDTPGGGTPASASGGPRISPALVKSRLAKADAAREKGRHVDAYADYKWIADRAASGGDENHAAAVAQVAAYEADEAFLAELKKAQSADAARAMLTTAQNYLDADKKDLAITTYQQVMDDHPDAAEAKQAKDALAKLKR